MGRQAGDDSLAQQRSAAASMDMTPHSSQMPKARARIPHLITCLLVVVLGSLYDPRFVLVQHLSGDAGLPEAYIPGTDSRATSFLVMERLGHQLGLGAPCLMAADHEKSRIFVLPRADLSDIVDSGGLSSYFGVP